MNTITIITLVVMLIAIVRMYFIEMHITEITTKHSEMVTKHNEIVKVVENALDSSVKDKQDIQTLLGASKDFYTQVKKLADGVYANQMILENEVVKLSEKLKELTDNII